MNRTRVLSWGMVLGCLLWGLPMMTTTTFANRSCESKRRRCLNKCSYAAKRKSRSCTYRALRRRASCIRVAHRSGRRCVRNNACPAARACYQKCNRSGNSVRCYADSGCAQKQNDCYAACQRPVGQALKQCLEATTAQLKGCSQVAESWQGTCQGRCPSCSQN